MGNPKGNPTFKKFYRTLLNSNAKKINYVYDAVGTKIKKMVNDNGNITTIDYAGNGVVYENNVLQFITTTEGYVTPNGNSWQYVYQYRDNIDNIRLSYTDADGNGTIAQNEIIEENNYQPFGLKMRGFNSNVSSLGNSVAQRYKFGGKEFDESFQSLNTYDFGARNYDPTLGRWMNLDPLASKYDVYSPYSYAFNSPIFFVDPDGKRIIGSRRSDAEKAKTDFNRIFANKKFNSFRNLIALSGKKFKKIGSNDLAAALKGVELSEDEQALVDTFVNTINSDDKHIVEFASNSDNLSTKALNVFKTEITNLGVNIEKSKEVAGGVSVRVISSQGGSVTKRTEDGTFSLIVDDAGSASDYFNTKTQKAVVKPGGRELATGHEVLGHGRSLATGRGNANQHKDAIQMENLIIRVMGHGDIQRNGTDHGTKVKINDASKRPSFN